MDVHESEVGKPREQSGNLGLHLVWAKHITAFQ